MNAEYYALGVLGVKPLARPISLCVLCVLCGENSISIPKSEFFGELHLRKFYHLLLNFELSLDF